MAFLFNKATVSLLFLFIFSSSSFPFIYSLSTVSISETSDQTLVCALVPQSPNTRQSLLNCSSFPSGIQVPLNYSSLSFSAVIAGDGFVCALISLSSSSSSNMVCWRFSANGTITSYKRIYEGPALSELEAGYSFACGLVKATNRLECWPRGPFNSSNIISRNFSSIAVGEDFVCGLSGSGGITCLRSNGSNAFDGQVPTGNYSMIATGFRHACAISLDNKLVCWGNVVGEEPEGEFISLALGQNRSCGLRTNETVVCWGQNNFSLPQNLQETNFITIEAKRNVFCGVSKSNFSLYCWGNGNLSSNLMVFDEVLPGPCASACPDGTMIGGSGRLCPEGLYICEHCKSKPNTPPEIEPPLPPPPKPQKSLSSNDWSGRMIAFLVVGCVGSLSLLLVIGFFLFKYCNCRGCRVHDSGRLDETGAPVEQGTSSQRQNPPSEQAPVPVLEKRLSQLASMGNAGHLEEFSLQVLLEATSNFSEDHKVGTGSFGSVYHGTLEDGRQVAIKRAETSSTCSYAIGTRRQEDKDNAFINELESLSRLHHKNLVRLLGFCEDSNERVLVYEFMHNGTLHDHLHKLEISPLRSWSARIKVALDAARGIEYLHEYAVPPVIHRDIKSSNILLDAMWCAKVSDFGLSLMGPQDDETHLSLRAAGTVGYMDPEYYRLQQLTTKSDVYSFGVVLLEILSGKKAIHKNENGVPRNVVDFVVPYIFQDEIHRVLDPEVPPPTPVEIEAVIYVGYLAADCVTLEGGDRPSMTEVVNSLERALAACLMHPTPLSRSTTGSST